MSIEESDRQMLQWAAKAAGITYSISNNGTFLITQSDNPHATVCWNPLINEGDRYRLARDLRGNLYFSGRRGCFEVPSDGDEPPIIEFFTVGDEKEEAYAIVKVAAKIGRNME